jgi:hypothetical protein
MGRNPTQFFNTRPRIRRPVAPERPAPMLTLRSATRVVFGCLDIDWQREDAFCYPEASMMIQRWASPAEKAQVQAKQRAIS